MQTNILNINKEMEAFTKRGSIDAKINQDILIDDKRIKPAARNAYYSIKAHYSGTVEKVKMKLDQIKSALELNDNEISSIKSKLNETEAMSLWKILVFYFIPGWLFVFGDIMFSKELIVKGWGLGGSGIYKMIEQWVLAIAIGSAPIYVKIFNERFIEPNLENGSRFIKRFLTFLHISLCGVVIFSFCQLAYVRGIFFKYQQIDDNEKNNNIYLEIFEFHDSSMLWAFILVALMFVLAGALSLSTSSKEMEKRKNQINLSRSLKKRIDKKEILLEKSSENTMKLKETETLLEEMMNKEEFIEHFENELKYAYKSGFVYEIKSNKERSSNNDTFKLEDSPENFHHYTKELIDKYSIQTKGSI